MNNGSAFQFDGYVRGYHVFMNICELLLGECLKCAKKPINEVDKHAIAVVRISKEAVVGHVPKLIPRLHPCFYHYQGVP